VEEECRIPDPDLKNDIGQVVASVRDLGERARFLAVNLAVATAKFKQMQVGGARLNDELLDLVAKVTRVAHDVSDAVAAIDAGFSEATPQSQHLWNAVETIGVPDERSLERLTQSLNDTLDLARHVLRWARQLAPAESGGQGSDWPDPKSDKLTNQ
jgi:hypothetical protein